MRFDRSDRRLRIALAWISMAMGTAFIAFGALADVERQPAGSDRLTEDELARWFESADVSHDGKIDAIEAEKVEALRGAMPRCDLDKSGALDESEFREEAVVAAMKKGRKVEDGLVAKVRQAREEDAKFALGEKALEGLDADRNGSLSRDELRAKIPPRRKNAEAWADPLFAAADADRDGSLSAPEFAAFQKSLADWARLAAAPSPEPIGRKPAR